MERKMQYPVSSPQTSLATGALSKAVCPELLALYKEVQEQYESGKLEVPDDVTLLFADDNFGTIRRLPCGNEKDRKGGAGVCDEYQACLHMTSS